MGKILFRSTNGGKERVPFSRALLSGQAPDFGLYMPESIPGLSPAELERLPDIDYRETALLVVEKFLREEIDREELRGMIYDVYTFPVPVDNIRGSLYLISLDRGPTASFKDFAALLMAKLLCFFAEQAGAKLTVLTATSGDTGGAIANAFYGLDNIAVAVLFPEKEITGIQRRQMTTFGRNVFPIAVRGKFDDCQALVKRAFSDSDLRKLSLTSANSINFGRLLPQMVYYFYAFSRISAERVVFSVPSGNFGNLMGGVFAREMGLPVERFIVSVNDNDEFPLFLQTGRYTPVVPSRDCSSNAMNVGHPSNLARLIDLYGGWLNDERDSSGEVTKKGVMKKSPEMVRLRRDFVSYAVPEKDVESAIRKYYREYGILIEPHGAVALSGAEKAGLTGMPIVAMETAHPAKFPEKIREVLGIEPTVPDTLKRLEGRQESFVRIDNNYLEFKEMLLQNL